MISVSKLRSQYKDYLNSSSQTNISTNKIDNRNAKQLLDEQEKVKMATSGEYKDKYITNENNNSISLTSRQLREQYKDILTANSKDNKLAISLSNRDNKQANLLNEIKIANEYPNLITLNPDTNIDTELSDFITTQNQGVIDDKYLNLDRAFIHLLQLTKRRNVEDILKEMTEDEMLFFNKNFPKIKLELKKNFSQLTKKEFLTYLRESMNTNAINPNFKGDFDDMSFLSAMDDIPTTKPRGDDPVLTEILGKRMGKSVTDYEVEYLIRNVGDISTLDNKFLKRILTFYNVEYPTKISRSKLLKEVMETLQIDDRETTTGKGLKKSTRSIIIKNAKIQQPKEYISIFDDNYLINANDLKNGILNIKNKKKQPIKHLTRENISKALQELITDTLNNEYDFNNFMKMTENERRIFKRFNKSLKLGLNVNDDPYGEFQKRYEILVAQLEAGNNAYQLKTEIKMYLLEAVKLGMITKNQMLEEILMLSI